MDTIEQMSRFFVNLGYPRDEVVATLKQEFPGEDADAAYDAAVVKREEQKARLQAQLDSQDARAVEAEHDMDKSMHDGWV